MVATVAVLATLIVPLSGADSRLEPVLLGGVAAGEVIALWVLGVRRLLWTVAGAAVLAAALLPSLTADTTWMHRVDLAAVMAIAALGVVVVTGWGGQPFLAPLAVSGICARTVIEMVDRLGQPPITAVCCALLLSLAIGALLGVMCAARSGEAAAVVTAGAAVLLDRAVGHPGGGALDGFDPPSARAGHALVLVLLGACLASVLALRRSRVRLGLVAGRGDPLAAAVRGVRVIATRLAAWTIAAFMAGVAGCALVLVRGGLPPAQLGAASSLRLVAAVMVLGASRSAAAIVAGAGLGLAVEPDGSAPEALDLVIGTCVVVGVLGREWWRAGHKSSFALLGPAAKPVLRCVTPSHKHGAGFGLMSGDAE